MKAKENAHERLKGWRWLKQEAENRVNILSNLLGSSPDPSGIRGILTNQRDTINSILDRELPLAISELEETLEDCAEERRRSGKSEKKGTKTSYIRQLVAAVKTKDPDVDGDDLYFKVCDLLDHEPSAEFPELPDEHKQIRRILRNLGHNISNPYRTKDTF